MNERIYNDEIERLRSAERIERLEVSKVADLVAEDKSLKSVLDIGTGSGLFAEELSKRNLKVTGIDSNPVMIEAARKHLPGISFHNAPAEALPFEDKSFDAAFMGLVFHEVDDYRKALSEAGRVSASAVYILEWKYRIEEFGPPLEHRLSRQFIVDTAAREGFHVEASELRNLVLYTLRK